MEKVKHFDRSKPMPKTIPLKDINKAIDHLSSREQQQAHKLLKKKYPPLKK